MASLVLVALAGCTTTQQEAARLRLNSARLRATEESVRVLASSRTVEVSQVSVVTDRTGSAVVVRLQNTGPRAVSDLPISLALISRGGRRRDLNGSPGLGYFATHLPAVPAGGGLSWVYTTNRHLPAAARVTAAIGSAASVPLPRLGSLPRVVATVGPPLADGRLPVRIRNTSPVPQYQLGVFAVVQRGRRYVAAGQTTVGALAAGADRELLVKLVGDSAHAVVAVQSPPTIFG